MIIATRHTINITDLNFSETRKTDFKKYYPFCIWIVKLVQPSPIFLSQFPASNLSLTLHLCIIPLKGKVRETERRVKISILTIKMMSAIKMFLT